MKVEQRTPVFFQLFGFYYQIHGSEFHQQADADAEYYALDPDNGLTMNLGVNPLLQLG